MRERRKFARYDVSRYPQLKGGTHNAPIGERMMTMSIGGCGFWAPADTCHLTVGEKVKLFLHCEGYKSDPVEMPAEVLYILPQPFESQVGKFYGLRFLDEYQEEIVRMMEQLDLEFQAGRLGMA